MQMDLPQRPRFTSPQPEPLEYPTVRSSWLSISRIPLPSWHLVVVSPEACDLDAVGVRNHLETKSTACHGDAKRGFGLFRFATALGTAAALDSAGFRTLDVMVGDPFFVESLGTSCDGRGIDIRGHSNLGLARSLLGRLTLLLWEVGNDPHGVEEVANTHCCSKEEDVEEEA